MSLLRNLLLLLLHVLPTTVAHATRKQTVNKEQPGSSPDPSTSPTWKSFEHFDACTANRLADHTPTRHTCPAVHTSTARPADHTPTRHTSPADYTTTTTAPLTTTTTTGGGAASALSRTSLASSRRSPVGVDIGPDNLGPTTATTPVPRLCGIAPVVVPVSRIPGSTSLDNPDSTVNSGRASCSDQDDTTTRLADLTPTRHTKPADITTTKTSPPRHNCPAGHTTTTTTTTTTLPFILWVPLTIPRDATKARFNIQSWRWPSRFGY